MNIGNKMKKDMNSGDSHQSYIYGVQNYSMPLCPNNQLFLFQPSMISNRLFTSNIPQTFSMQDSGNMAAGPTFGGENNKHSAMCQPFQSQSSGVSIQSNGYLMMREATSAPQNGEIPSLNSLVSKIKQGNCNYYQHNKNYINPQRMNPSQDARDRDGSYAKERRSEFANRHSNGKRSPPLEEPVAPR